MSIQEEDKRGEFADIIAFIAQAIAEIGLCPTTQCEQGRLIRGLSVLAVGMSDERLLQQIDRFGKFVAIDPNSRGKFGSASILKGLKEFAFSRELIDERPDWTTERGRR